MMASIICIPFLILIVINKNAVNGVPQLDGLSSVATEVSEWTQKIQDLVELTKSTLTDMGQIAVDDNPNVGTKIVSILNCDIAKVAQILADFTASTVSSSISSTYSGLSSSTRFKRDTGKGDKAYNDAGTVLVNSNNDIASDKKQLSPGAQKKIDKKHREGVEKCGADSCKAAAKILAESDNDSDRQ